MYSTQPLLPFLQRVYKTTPIGVSLTVSSTILAVALMAPVVGLVAESIGRKEVIFPSLYALTVPTLLAATSQSLHTLIIWRFSQGIFVPGVIVLLMAYINQEFLAFYVGRVMAAYVTGTPCSADFRVASFRAWRPIISTRGFRFLRLEC